MAPLPALPAARPPMPAVADPADPPCVAPASALPENPAFDAPPDGAPASATPPEPAFGSPPPMPPDERPALAPAPCPAAVLPPVPAVGASPPSPLSPLGPGAPACLARPQATNAQVRRSAPRTREGER